MRKAFATFAVVALALAGCGTTGEDEATVSNTPAPSTSKTTSSATPTSQTSSETSEPEAPAEQTESQAETVPAEQPAVQAPTFVQCQMVDGTALMSDGTTTYVDSCNESAGGPYLDLNGNPIGPSAHGANSVPGASEQIWGGPYQCPQTDAFVSDPALCTPENLGGEPYLPTPGA